MYLEQICVPEGRRQTEDVVPLGVLRDRLHDCAVDDDQVLRSGLHGAALAGVARVEQERGALQADPVALPAALASQLDLRREQSELRKCITYIVLVS